MFDKQIGGTMEGNSYFVVAEKEGITVGFRAIIVGGFGVTGWGFRVRAVATEGADNNALKAKEVYPNIDWTKAEGHRCSWVPGSPVCVIKDGKMGAGELESVMVQGGFDLMADLKLHDFKDEAEKKAFRIALKQNLAEVIKSSKKGGKVG